MSNLGGIELYRCFPEMELALFFLPLFNFFNIKVNHVFCEYSLCFFSLSLFGVFGLRLYFSLLYFTVYHLSSKQPLIVPPLGMTWQLSEMHLKCLLKCIKRTLTMFQTMFSAIFVLFPFGRSCGSVYDSFLWLSLL